MKKKYTHLVKPFLVQNPPAGLYPEPRMWMEGKDLEGFNAHFSYGFIKEPCTCHPQEGALLHPYDECLVFAGTKHTDIFYLGAEIAVELGEEREEHVITEPSVVIIPKGLPHGPVTIRKVDRPIVHYSVGLAPDYKAEALPKDSLPPKSAGTRYKHLIKKLGILEDLFITDQDGKRVQKKMGPGNADQIAWLFGKDLGGLEVNFSWGFYTQCGKWHRDGEAHTHPEEEILVFAGLDPDNLKYLGSEIEIALGYEYERHVFNTPTVVICPQGFPHNPVVTRWVDAPYSFIVCCLSGEHDSPWVEVPEE